MATAELFVSMGQRLLALQDAVNSRFGAAGAAGLVPPADTPGDTTHFLRQDGSWGVPPSAGGTTVTAKTAAYPVLSADSGTYFTNEGAAASITFTLPTAVAGLVYTFIVQDADGIVVQASAGDTIRAASTATAVAGSFTSTVIGSILTIISINATEWIAIGVLGTWSIA